MYYYNMGIICTKDRTKFPHFPLETPFTSKISSQQNFNSHYTAPLQIFLIILFSTFPCLSSVQLILNNFQRTHNLNISNFKLLPSLKSCFWSTQCHTQPQSK